MTTVIDVSSKLGEYMLKGWVLTDRTCTKCSKVPLMRSPRDSTVYFCANCDGGPPSTTSSMSTARPATHAAQAQSEGSSSASMDSTSHRSRPSTPLTEISSTLSSPTFAPAVDTAEVLRRRQQSDAASAEIGKRLLKGWAMLADECPNSQCYGIPLVRPPKSGAEKDPRKECVICHTVYVDQVDDNGFQLLVPMQSGSQSSSAPAKSTSTEGAPTRTPRSAQTGQIALLQPISSLRPTVVPADQVPDISSLHDLDSTTQALEQSLRCLTQRLNFFSSGNNVDATMIGQAADAIGKVSQALMHVKQLRWSEQQALGS